MIRSSSVLRRTVPVVGALLAAAVLTACGGAAHPGAAAVVGQDRISVSAVQAQVAAYRAESAALPGAANQESGDLVQSTVYRMVLSDVVGHALASHGLTVSDSEVAQVRQSQVQAFGGEAELAQQLLGQAKVPAGQINAFYREQLGLNKLAGLSGRQLRTSEGNKAVHQLLTEASLQLKVTVNPRYGSWDAQEAMVTGPWESWLPQSATAM